MENLDNEAPFVTLHDKLTGVGLDLEKIEKGALARAQELDGGGAPTPESGTMETIRLALESVREDVREAQAMIDDLQEEVQSDE